MKPFWFYIWATTLIAAFMIGRIMGTIETMNRLAGG